MTASQSGFRSMGTRDPRVPGDPRFVLYRLDPATLAFTEVGGRPDRLLGFPPGDWYGARFWPGRLHPEDREAVGAFFEGLASSWRDEQLEYRVIDAAGRTVWVRQIVWVERDSGEVAVRGILIDVTDRVARDAEVERALFLKGELFRIIAEELAPPVRAMSADGDMLGRHLSAQGDDVGSDYAVGLREGLERLDTTLGQLMRIAQSGGVPPADGSAGPAAPHRGDRIG